MACFLHEGEPPTGDFHLQTHAHAGRTQTDKPDGLWRGRRLSAIGGAPTRMTPKAYVEPSVINRAADHGVDGPTLRAAIQANGFTPSTGLHTIYELARGYLPAKSSNPERMAALFTILRDAQPAFQPHLPALLGDELLKLRTGAAVLPFLDQLDDTSASQEVARLAEGHFDRRARDFISGKEHQKAEERLAHGQYVEEAATIRQRNPAARSLKTYNDVWRYFEEKGQFPHIVRAIIDRDLSVTEASEMVARLDSFPATRNAIRANVYLMFIMITKHAKPGKDKLDDYRHMIEASYCAAFVTADNQQIGAAPFICPELTLIPWSQIGPKA